MSPEIFVIDRKPAITPQEEHRAEYLLEKILAAEEVGLTAEATLLKAELSAVEKGGLITASPLTADECAIWGAWLPTSYGDVVGTWRSLAHYSFDRVPAPVLKKWQAHKAAGDFEHYEIWTPERHIPDPILIGVNGTMRHLLARWGESDANLVTFDDIKKKLLVRWVGKQAIGMAVAALMAFVFIGFLLAIATMPGPRSVSFLSASVVPFVTAGAAMIFIVGSVLIMRRLYLTNPVMQAIRRHKSVDREMEAPVQA